MKFSKCKIFQPRLDDIACDAELQEKSESELKRMANLLQNGCENAMKEHEEKMKEIKEEDETNKGSVRFL